MNWSWNCSGTIIARVWNGVQGRRQHQTGQGGTLKSHIHSWLRSFGPADTCTCHGILPRQMISISARCAPSLNQSAVNDLLPSAAAALVGTTLTQVQGTHTQTSRSGGTTISGPWRDDGDEVNISTDYTEYKQDSCTCICVR